MNPVLNPSVCEDCSFPPNFAVNCISNSSYFFMMDNLKVGATVEKETFNLDIIDIYPNPSNDILNISLSLKYDRAYFNE